MLEKADAQLLRDYADHRNEAAFRELVSRHADVVYASALRQVSSPDLAHDITQSVFTDLARKAQPLAGTLTGDASLLGWLYRSTRFLALNQMRDDRRRQARERHAMEHFDPASETVPEWERVQPVLDEAMAELSDEDRDALLLRFFKNRDFRAIGAALGVSDDAAQKRVSRALERLRTQLTSRGVTTTAVALSTVLSTNAVPLAPVGLAATLSTTALAGTTLATTATATAIKTVAMTTLQKTLVTAVLAVVAGAGIYEARQASTLRKQNQALQQQQAPLADQLQQFQREREEAARMNASLRDENDRLNRNAAELLKLRGEVGTLRNEARDAVALGKEAMAFQAEVMQVLSNTPPVRTLVDTSTASVPWNDTVVLGGWKTPSGRRAIVMATVGHGDDATQITITSRILEYTDSAGVSFGLSKFNTDFYPDQPAPARPNTLTAEQANGLLRLVESSEEVTLVSAPRITTRSGGQGQIQSVEIRSTPSGQKYPTGPVLDVLPTISPDGQSVLLVMTAQLNYLIPVLLR